MTKTGTVTDVCDARRPSKGRPEGHTGPPSLLRARRRPSDGAQSRRGLRAGPRGSGLRPGSRRRPGQRGPLRLPCGPRRETPPCALAQKSRPGFGERAGLGGAPHGVWTPHACPWGTSPCSPLPCRSAQQPCAWPRGAPLRTHSRTSVVLGSPAHAETAAPPCHGGTRKCPLQTPPTGRATPSDGRVSWAACRHPWGLSARHRPSPWVP